MCEGGDPNQLDEDGVPILVLAAGVRAARVVSLLVKAGAELDAQDLDGDTALHRAGAIGAEEVVRTLVGAGATINFRNHDGKTPIMVAAAMGHFNVCRFLIAADADMEIVDLKGRNCLHWAALRNDDPELAILLIRGGASPSHCDKAGATPGYLAKLLGHLKVSDAINDAINRC